MRRLILLACGVLLIAFAKTEPNPRLQSVHAVYILPMANSLDQYLANALTQTGLVQVVTDPQKADTIFTDKIGEGFQKKLEELYPPPEAKTEQKDEETDKEKDPYGKPAQRFGSFSRGHGTVFLVDRQSRNVVWSIYCPVHSSSANDVNSCADQIVSRLRKEIRGK